MGALGGDFLRSAGDSARSILEAFEAGFVTAGPGGVVTVHSHDDRWCAWAPVDGEELRRLRSGIGDRAGRTSFFDTLSRAFEGGGGFMGGLKSLASKAFGQIFSKIGGGLAEDSRTR